MSNKKKRLWVAAIVALYAAIAIVGFFIIYFFKNLIVTKPQSEPVAKEQTVTSREGFIRYDIEKNKFSIEYPERLKVSESSFGLGVKTISLENTAADKQAEFQILKAPKPLAKTIGQDFDAFYKMKDGESKIIQSPSGDQKENFTKVTNREIQNFPAIEYNAEPSPNTNNATPEIGVIIDAKGTLILITTKENFRTELEEMLKTFKSEQ